MVSRKPDKGEDAAQKDGERQKLLSQIRKLEDGHCDDDPARYAAPGGAIQQIDDIDGEREQEEGTIDCPHADQELNREVSVERPGPTHAGLSTRCRKNGSRTRERSKS